MTGNEGCMAIVGVCTVYDDSMTCVQVLGGHMQGLGAVMDDLGVTHGMAPRLEPNLIVKRPSTPFSRSIRAMRWANGAWYGHM